MSSRQRPEKELNENFGIHAPKGEKFSRGIFENSNIRHRRAKAGAIPSSLKSARLCPTPVICARIALVIDGARDINENAGELWHVYCRHGDARRRPSSLRIIINL